MNTLFIVSACILFVFAVTNGMKDGSNVAATAISSLSLTRLQAIAIVAAAEFAGPFILGSKVAMTVSNNIINQSLLASSLDSMLLLMSGVAGALLWNVITWRLRLPTSSSFSIIGGMIGPFIYRYGAISVPWRIFFLKVILAMFLSPIIGMFAGFLFHDLVNSYLSHAHLRLNKSIKKLQAITLVFLGANHGTNDSQKIMGMMILFSAVAGRHAGGGIPLWIKLLSVTGITIGVTLGGTKIIKTVGYCIFKIQPLHALESQLAASGILLACNMIGAPVSTTQIISSSVMGVGSCTNKKLVRWQLIKDIFWSWLLTIPMAGGISIVIYLILSKIL